MKTRILPFAVSILLPFHFLMAQPDQDVIAYYTFDHPGIENEVDFYSDGQIIGDPKIQKGLLGGAVYFDGTKDEILFDGVVNDYLSADREFSLSFYFRAGNIAQEQSLMGKRSRCDGFHHFDIRVGQQLLVELYERQNPTIGCRLAVDIPDQRWHHYVVVRERFGARLYLDGRLVMSRYTVAPIYIKDEYPFGINNSPCKDTEEVNHLFGALDELKVYRRALFSDEIRFLYDFLSPQQRRVNARMTTTPPPSNRLLTKIFGTYRSSDSENRAQLQLNPQEFILTINRPESYRESERLVFRGKYKIEAGQLLLEQGDLELRGATGDRQQLNYAGPRIIGDIYGETVTIDLLAFETRLKMIRQQ